MPRTRPYGCSHLVSLSVRCKTWSVRFSGGNSIWDSKSKARIVLEGLQGRSVASLCSEYQITQSMYYRWRDTFLANAAQAFEASTTNRREERLSAENQRLKLAVGELTLELKKNDW